LGQSCALCSLSLPLPAFLAHTACLLLHVPLPGSLPLLLPLYLPSAMEDLSLLLSCSSYGRKFLQTGGLSYMMPICMVPCLFILLCEEGYFSLPPVGGAKCFCLLTGSGCLMDWALCTGVLLPAFVPSPVYADILSVYLGLWGPHTSWRGVCMETPLSCAWHYSLTRWNCLFYACLPCFPPLYL